VAALLLAGALFGRPGMQQVRDGLFPRGNVAEGGLASRLRLAVGFFVEFVDDVFLVSRNELGIFVVILFGGARPLGTAIRMAFGPLRFSFAPL
jgi:hypothetical protein